MSTTLAATPRRFAFIPWTRSTAGDYAPKTAAASWNESEEFPLFRYVWHEDLTQLPFLFGHAAEDVTIYVLGHGGSGVDRISNLRENGESVDAQGIHDALKAGGLATDFAGRIKFYSCRSADGQEASFACQCASLMRKNGYILTRFFGYTGRITLGYKDTGEERHRFTDDLEQISKMNNMRARKARLPVRFDGDKVYMASEEQGFTGIH